MKGLWAIWDTDAALPYNICGLMTPTSHPPLSHPAAHHFASNFP